MRSGVVLLAAGAGKRVGGRPKQFQLLNGAPLFMTSLRVFASMPTIKEIVVVVGSGHVGRVTSLLKRLRTRTNIAVVEGGAFRGASVRNGVRALSKNLDVVLVHDSARPLVDKNIVQRVVKAAQQTGVALAAWPLPDTLKMSNGQQLVKKTIPRQKLWLAQTPQGFRRDIADKCLLSASRTATDDVALAERKRFKVKIVEGSAINFKVTYPEDLKLCRLLAK